MLSSAFIYVLNTTVLKVQNHINLNDVALAFV